jgi:hypothetical protein
VQAEAVVAEMKVRALVQKLSVVLGVTSGSTCCSRFYSLLVCGVVNASCVHVLYVTGLEPRATPSSDARALQFFARTATVLAYIAIHIFTFKNADRCVPPLHIFYETT